MADVIGEWKPEDGWPLPEVETMCDSCGTQSECRFTSWKEGVRFIGAFLCDICRQAIPNDEKGWGRDA